jgi:hypothetical protein
LCERLAMSDLPAVTEDIEEMASAGAA